MRRRRPKDKFSSEKRKKSYRITQIENKHHCRLGSIVSTNGNLFLVAIATPLFVFLINKGGDHKQLSWQEWDQKKPKNENSHFLWNKRVREKIKFLKKKIKFEWKLRKINKVDKFPKIKRTPVKRQTEKPTVVRMPKLKTDKPRMMRRRDYEN